MNFNLNLLLTAIQVRYRLIVLILMVTVLVTLAVSLVVPKTYVATASLLLDGKDEQSMRTSNSQPERERAGYMQTQMDLITSPGVAHRAVAQLGLAASPEMRKAFIESGSAGTLDDWLSDSLLRGLSVDVSSSSIVLLSYSADSGSFAAKAANAFAQAYVATALELRVEPKRQTSLWFDEQLKSLRTSMAEAESRLTEFRQEHGMVAADERYDIDNVQLTELVSLIARSQDAGSESTPRNGGLNESLPEVLSSPSVQALRVDLARAQSKLQELSSELGERHPTYLRQLAEVQVLRVRVDSEIRLAMDSRAAVKQRARQRKDRLIGDMEAQRQRVLGLKQARNQLAMLVHDVDSAQRTYDSAMQRFMVTKIESQAQQTNVRVLDEAVVPARAKRPRIGLNVLLAAVIGGLLGMAAAYLLELSNRRVRQLEDLGGDFGIPLLGTLSKHSREDSRLPGMGPAQPALPHL